MAEKRDVYRVLVGNLKEKDQLEDTGLDGKIILRWISGSGMWVYGLDRAGSG